MRSIDRSRVCHVTDREAMAVIPERRVESVHCCARHNLSRRSPAVPTVQLGSPLDQFVSQSRVYRRRPFSWKRSGAAERGNATFPPPGPLLRRPIPSSHRSPSLLPFRRTRSLSLATIADCSPFSAASSPFSLCTRLDARALPSPRLLGVGHFGLADASFLFPAAVRGLPGASQHGG